MTYLFKSDSTHRFFKKNFFLLFFFGAALLTAASCTNKNKQKPADTAATELNRPTKPKASASASAACPGNAEMQEISGPCQGTWRITQSGDEKVCEFQWGPTIRCPAGTKALTGDAACYGFSKRSLVGEKSIDTAEGCAEKFGKIPSEAFKYYFKCCPI
ncbi:MAG: hypothetical protein A2Z20_10650 [Bdellovibrionales bacterium RBG_16_40_8]|nr:MAG: hypothetical protein A2Z20_10650 [Bdellovibrionales bacterium RBG_16_40_8]